MADLYIITIGPRVSWLGGEKVEALLPLATLGFGVAQNREKVSLEVEVLRYGPKRWAFLAPFGGFGGKRTRLTFFAYFRA